jgi:hypothetical protein
VSVDDAECHKDPAKAHSLEFFIGKIEPSNLNLGVTTDANSELLRFHRGTNERGVNLLRSFVPRASIVVICVDRSKVGLSTVDHFFFS